MSNNTTEKQIDSRAIRPVRVHLISSVRTTVKLLNIYSVLPFDQNLYWLLLTEAVTDK